MFVKFFFCDFRTFNFSRTMNGIDNHLFLFRCRRKMFVAVCDSSFHNSFVLLSVTDYTQNEYNFQEILLKVSNILKINYQNDKYRNKF